jgi:hypothetical protein
MADFTGVVVAGPPISEPANLERVGVVVPTPGSPPIVIQYYQRVWSTGTAEWCYYVQAAINPAPTPAETSPNWVASAIDHNVIAIL